MTKTLLLVTILLALLTTGSGRVRRESDWGSTQIRDLARSTYYDFVVTGKLAEARARYQQAYHMALQGGFRRAVPRLLIAMANCDLVQLDYRAAIRRYSEAIGFANRSGDHELASVIHSNLSSIYLQLYDLTNAAREAENGLSAKHLESDLQLGWIRSLQGRPDDALGLLRGALLKTDSVDERMAPTMRGLVLTRLGSELLSAGRLAEADAALSRAYAIRRMIRDPNLNFTCLELARLRLAQSDLEPAAHLIDSVLSASPSGRIPEYEPLYVRGQIRRAQGDLEGAVEDFRRAVSAAAKWRGKILPADAFRTSTDAGLQRIFEAFIGAAVTLSLRTGDQTLLAEAFETAEANRAASLREAILASSATRAKLPAEYWDSLAQLRAIEARGLAESNAGIRSSINKLQLRITELEAQAGLSGTKESIYSEKNLSQVSLTTVRKGLGNSRTLMSFHLGEKASYCWLVNRTRFSVAVLPPAATLNRHAAEFRQLIEANDPKARSLGETLYSELFSQVAPQGTGEWLLALDGRLFEIPFPALPASRDRYLIENSTVQIVPGAWAIGNQSPDIKGTFLAVADPIYSEADPRFQSRANAAVAPLGPFGGIERSAPPSAQLPRLVGSQLEAASAASAWKQSATVLTGERASRAALSESIVSARPGVIHIATHFVPSRQTADETMIALSLRPGVSGPLLELLTSHDIASMRIPGSLVILSGCSSGSGRSLPGAGLLGLTRAFLAAGASGVIATHWPTPDDSGALFTSFYRHLNTDKPDSPNPADALRVAQVEMLHSSTWRSSPRYWAAYQLMGRSN